jgi:hypothetical protein
MVPVLHTAHETASCRHAPTHSLQQTKNLTDPQHTDN